MIIIIMIIIIIIIIIMIITTTFILTHSHIHIHINTHNPTTTTTTTTGLFWNLEWEPSKLSFLEFASLLLKILCNSELGLQQLLSDKRSMMFHNFMLALNKLTSGIGGSGGISYHHYLLRPRAFTRTFAREYMYLLGKCSCSV